MGQASLACYEGFDVGLWTLCPLCFILPEQEEKAVDLQNNPDDGPANQHHKHTSQEETGGLHLVLLEEEAEGPLQPDDEGKSSNKKDLQWKRGSPTLESGPIIGHLGTQTHFSISWLKSLFRF